MVIISTYLPRERAQKVGLEKLSEYELIALVFRTGTAKKDVLSVSKELLKGIEGIEGLGTVTLAKLCQYSGVGESKAYSLLAGLELGKRLFQVSVRGNSYQLTSPKDCVGYFSKEFKFYQQECFVVVFLSTKNRVIGYKEVYRGGLNAVNVHPREIFKAAIEVAAASIILFHNHPSGDPNPSKADFEATDMLIKAAKIIGIPILDHVVVAGDAYVSFRELGYFEKCC
ncbi:MAG: RadC family protein [Culicoidibacterales bacterium]